MTKLKRACLFVGAVASPSAIADPASAATAIPLKYECNAPVDQYASIPQPVTLPVQFHGTISASVLKSEDYSPSISMAVISNDDTWGVGFQLVADDDDAAGLNIERITKDGPNQTDDVVGHTTARADIPVSFSVDVSGEMVMKVSGVAITASIKSIRDLKMVASCTSGHFSIEGTFAGAKASAPSGKGETAR